MKKEIANPFPGRKCFFCGKDNIQGLHLKSYHDQESGETSTDYVLEKRFLGQGNILHGGIQVGLLDEVMGWASFVHTNTMAVTTKIDVQFLKPVYVNGESARITCHVTDWIDKEVYMLAELINSQNIVCTKATGVYRIVEPDKFEMLING